MKTFNEVDLGQQMLAFKEQYFLADKTMYLTGFSALVYAGALVGHTHLEVITREHTYDELKKNNPNQWVELSAKGPLSHNRGSERLVLNVVNRFDLPPKPGHAKWQSVKVVVRRESKLCDLPCYLNDLGFYVQDPFSVVQSCGLAY